MSLPDPAPSRPSLELVVACSENDVIGRGNALPWHLPDDLRRFKALTLGRPILMGRKTCESIGRPLPGRLNLVLSRRAAPPFPGVQVVADLPAALAAAGPAQLMVIGGGDIYAQVLPLARRIHLTLVHAVIADGDAFFRGWRGSAFSEVSREEHGVDEKHAFAFSFLTLERS
jgi:dihydrofolate reductase